MPKARPKRHPPTRRRGTSESFFLGIFFWALDDFMMFCLIKQNHTTFFHITVFADDCVFGKAFDALTAGFWLEPSWLEHSNHHGHQNDQMWHQSNVFAATGVWRFSSTEHP